MLLGGPWCQHKQMGQFSSAVNCAFPKNTSSTLVNHFTQRGRKKHQ